ncbi:MAG: branched-chain amino acid ABC transporter permease [Burkholderiales bacterium]|nr:branched-chain amino acid ABC transporter permease [Burkholderiales bacterium]
MGVQLDHPLHAAVALPLLAALIVFPFVVLAIDEPFYVVLASRILIFALVATSLNLLVGFGGMVSFGHAAFLGAGAYVVAILMQHGVASAWIAWPAAVAVAALAALAIGAVCLRTRGVYFIMITLAFAQMVYFVFVSLKAYGGDDGLSLASRSVVAPGIDLNSDTLFYYVVLAFASTGFFLFARLVNSRFGRVLQGIRENETRMEALGYAVHRYKLGAFVLAGATAGLGGALLVNQNELASPGTLSWTQSGMLLTMVILGGVGYLWGGVMGAAALLLMEELLAAYTIHWQLGLGLVLLAVVLFAPNGLATLARAAGPGGRDG